MRDYIEELRDIATRVMDGDHSAESMQKLFRTVIKSSLEAMTALIDNAHAQQAEIDALKKENARIIWIIREEYQDYAERVRMAEQAGNRDVADRLSYAGNVVLNLLDQVIER